MIIASLEANTAAAGQNNAQITKLINGLFEVHQVSKTLIDRQDAATAAVDYNTLAVKEQTKAVYDLNLRLDTDLPQLYQKVAAQEVVLAEHAKNIRELRDFNHSMLGSGEQLGAQMGAKIDTVVEVVGVVTTTVDRKLKEATDKFAVIAKESATTATASKAHPVAQAMHAFRELDPSARRSVVGLLILGFVLLATVAVVGAKAYVSWKLDEKPKVETKEIQ